MPAELSADGVLWLQSNGADPERGDLRSTGLRSMGLSFGFGQATEKQEAVKIIRALLEGQFH